jgi:signal transduction histidine kinase
MIRDLLDANRVHAGETLPLVISKCDLVDIARETIEELRTLHGTRFGLAGDDSVVGRWDADQVRRCLWNLGVNAAKYGVPDAPITVSVRAKEDHAELSVHNEGAPIAPEDHAALFEPFRRARAAHTSRAKGWGLGLTLVRGAAEAHRGRVRVESAASTGTTFTIELPYDAPRAS